MNLAPPRVARVFLVDDHPLVREGLRKIIAQEADLTVCGEAEDAQAAFEGIAQTLPDAVIVDISLRGDSGLDLIKRLQDAEQTPRILVLSMHDELHYAERALRAGALGYMMKSESSGKVLEALRQILSGKTFVSASIGAHLAEKFVGLQPRTATAPIDRLSDRELEIFRLIGQGHETRRVAEELHLSLKTVHTHCAHIKEKLGCRNATALMLQAVRWVEDEQRGPKRS